MNGKEYSPDSLYQICCGLHRSLKDNNRSENIFDDAEFAEFRGVHDGQLKGLNRTGKYVEKKRASIITTEMEEQLFNPFSPSADDPLSSSISLKLCYSSVTSVLNRFDGGSSDPASS